MWLVSGASSGLGKYLADELNAQAFDRATLAPKGDIPTEGYEGIIHCAFGMPAKEQTEADYHAGNVAVAESLLKLPHQRFVFISSVDVLKSEPDQTPYARSKIAIEKVVLEKAVNLLVLRPGALLGKGMRASQLLKVARGEIGPFSLAAESTFAPVMYSDVLESIRLPSKHNTLVVAGRMVTLGVIAKKAGTQPQFGNYRYETPSVAKQKTADVARLKEDPVERVMGFVAQQGWL